MRPHTPRRARPNGRRATVVTKASTRAITGAVACLAWTLTTQARADDPLPEETVDETSDDDVERAITVDVKGSLLPRASDPASASTVIEGDDLDRPGASTADVLASSPGTQVSRTGGSAELATVTLRGASSAQTPVYLGPIALNDELTGTADLSTIPTFFLRRIEIHRGHAPLELEQGGLSGAVVLVPQIASGTRVGVTAGGGSWETSFASLGASVAGRGGAASVALRVDRTAGTFEYEDDRGTAFDESDDRIGVRRNADALSLDLWTAGRVDLGDGGSADLLVRAFTREQGVPGLGLLPALRARARSRQLFVVARGEVGCGADTPLERCRVEAATSARLSSYLLEDPAGELLFVGGRQETVASTVGTRVAVTMAPSSLITVKAGTSVGIGRVHVDPLGATEIGARRTTFRAFASGSVRPEPWLDVILDGSVQSDALVGSSDASQVTPQGRLGAAVRPIEGLELFTSGGHYARVPTLGEQFGVTATVLGNPSLAPESGWSGDIGARTEVAPNEQARLAAEVVFFGRSANDLIAYQRSSFGVLKPFNVASARFLGLEASAAGRFFGWLHAGASVTWTDARDRSEDRALTNDLLPLQAQLEVSPSAGVHFRDILPRVHWDSARVIARFQYRGRRAADPAGLIELPSQALLDLEASIGLARGAFEITGRLSNLLDDRTTDLVGYPLPGRAGYVSVSAWVQ